MRLAVVFLVTRPNENAAARNRIQQKHVDFLLCDPATMRPLAGIELDDASHARADRQERDAFVEQVFTASALPLVRFPAQRAYTLAEVEGKLSVVFGDGLRGERPPTGDSVASGASTGGGAAGNVAEGNVVEGMGGTGSRRAAVPEVRRRADDPLRPAGELFRMLELPQVPGDGEGGVRGRRPSYQFTRWIQSAASFLEMQFATRR